MAELSFIPFSHSQLAPPVYIYTLPAEELRYFLQSLTQSRIELMGTKEIERRILSSASIHQWKYDVFVSFVGEDIRKTFAAHLFHALKQAGIHHFKDNDKAKTGSFIEPKLLDTIHHSRVSLIMFTTNYADSWGCLNELVKILERNRRFRDHQGHVVVPIFYDVEPSDVRKQSWHFGDGFRRCLATHMDDLLVQKWRDVLKEAGNLSGWRLNNDANGDQADSIKQIVGHLFKIIPRASYPCAIGVDSFVDDVISSLEIRSEDDVCVIGIWKELARQLWPKSFVIAFSGNLMMLPYLKMLEIQTEVLFYFFRRDFSMMFCSYKSRNV